MAKSQGPIERAWHASLLLLGCAVALSLTLQVLASLWGWLLLVAAVGLLVAALAWWRRRRRDDW